MNILQRMLLPVFIFGCGLVDAHPMPNSLVQLSVMDGTIVGEVKVPLLELESALQAGPIVEIHSVLIREYFENHIVARSQGGVWQTSVTKIGLLMDHDRFVGDYQEVVINFEMVPSAPEDLRHFTFDYDAVIHQVVTHRVAIFLRSDWGNGIVEDTAGRPLGVIETDVRTGKIMPLQIDLQEGSWFKGVWSMFRLGMNHILEGVDHLLFLLTLLLVAPLAIVDHHWSGFQGWRYTIFRFLRISVAFTIGHSITLLIGALSLVEFNIQYVEVLIAVSIFISAANCIRPTFFKRETKVAAGFGLVHGLAFSISLSHLQVGTTGKLLSVLGFNLGIEVMQLLVMVCFFPLLMLSKTRVYPSLRIAVAVLAMALSIAWMAERINGHENFVTHYVNRAMS